MKRKQYKIKKSIKIKTKSITKPKSLKVQKTSQIRDSVFEIQCLEGSKGWVTFHHPADLATARAMLAWNQDNARMSRTDKEFRVLQDGEVLL